MSQTGKLKSSQCLHVPQIGPVSWDSIKKAQKNEICDTCEIRAPYLWRCLIGTCSYIGCGESIRDHSSLHAQLDNHCLAINLATLRIWCYLCEAEVYKDRNTPTFIIPERLASDDDDNGMDSFTTDNSPQHSAFGGDDTESDGEDSHHGKPKGLTGLQNLGNTCYLNAALQALSNCPPLTRYFLDCPGFIHSDKSPMLSKNYMKLMNEIWHRKRPSFLVPSGIVSGIKLVHPMFRGYSQQDTQEFLRCFMDQLHEELKQPIIEENDDMEVEHHSSLPVQADRQFSLDTSSTSSQSDCDYETCDSALGSEREANLSSDENSDINDLSRKNKTGSHGNLTNTFSKMEDGSDVSNRPSYLKEKKDSINMSKKVCDNISTCSEDQRSESGDYVDAESEPLRPPRRGLRTLSGSVERDQMKYSSSQSADLNQSAGQGTKRTVQYQSVISDIFDGNLSSSVQCLTCERVSTTKETFQDLSLPIPSKDHVHMLHSSTHNPGQKGGSCSEVHQGWIQWMVEWMRSWFLGPMITLQDCLAAFFSADELKGDNMYSCEKCKKLRNGLKYSKVLQLPEILCIHLKRFRHEFYSSKISTYVSFPLTNLDMKPYLHKDHTSTVTAYDLVAVICHHGTAGGGHYTAYCQNVLSEQWYEFDDQYVTEVDVSQVINCEAYVLFYRKQNDHMNTVRQEAMHLMNKGELYISVTVAMSVSHCLPGLDCSCVYITLSTRTRL
ncbi:Ubiquitin carboxyl-terminal hydrolase 20 [Mactra antiquata]